MRCGVMWYDAMWGDMSPESNYRTSIAAIKGQMMVKTNKNCTDDVNVNCKEPAISQSKMKSHQSTLFQWGQNVLELKQNFESDSGTEHNELSINHEFKLNHTWSNYSNLSFNWVEKR